MGFDKGKGLPLPPPVVPSNLVPELEPIKKNTLLPMARRGSGTKGVKTHLLTNHFRVNFNNSNGHFFHCSVAITYEDGRPVEAKGIGRKILEKVQETYRTDLGSKYFAYDGEKTLFTVGALPSNKMDFSVVLEDTPSSRNNTGNASPNESNDADRKRSRRPNRSKKFMVEISYAARIPMQAIASALQGKETDYLQDAIRVLDVILRQSAARQGCLLVRQSFFHNDVQNFVHIGGGVTGVRNFHSSFRTTQGGLSLNIVQPGPVIDFLLANQNVKDPKLDVLSRILEYRLPLNREYKITGLSEERCKDQMFTRNSKNEKGEVEEIQTTVYKYFTEFRGIPLRYSGNFPCINVGKPKRPTYIPIEHCELVSLQRYTKSLSSLQRASLVEKSRQRPPERMASLTNGLKKSNYNADLVLQDCGVSIGSNFTQVEGRVLPTPRLKVGNGEEFQPRDGRWNFNYKVLVNFSARCDTKRLISDLIGCGRMKGINVEPPYKVVFQEDPDFRGAPANIRVQKMFEQMQSELRKEGKPKFILCILAEKKNSLVYGPWKRRNLVEEGIVTQSWWTELPVSYGALTTSNDAFSNASLYLHCWDGCIPWELLFDFYTSSGNRRPEHNIIFRDGVSESKFNQVLNIELDQMMQACKFVEENWEPKFTVIIAQKNHHTKFFQAGGPGNVPPALHSSTLPTHYHVLYDEIGFSTDDLQELVHSLSYVYQRSTTAISVVAPVCYAHLAAAQMGTVMKFEDMSLSETSSTHGGITTPGAVPVPPMPKLNVNVASSMFFC
ncbi:hypothetical protein HID58_088544 [Brassica napus]|uniref:Uncharacterized protein n=1 Tax=Brassica napus TaxID=3708 RepID=A0ABQ7XWH8_BRANA|nr:hypothetical protein HID58_088544 [Brassica napus]